jgi:hypothetical protein
MGASTEGLSDERIQLLKRGNILERLKKQDMGSLKNQFSRLHENLRIRTGIHKLSQETIYFRKCLYKRHGFNESMKRGHNLWRSR